MGPAGLVVCVAACRFSLRDPRMLPSPRRVLTLPKHQSPAVCGALPVRPRGLEPPLDSGRVQLAKQGGGVKRRCHDSVAANPLASSKATRMRASACSRFSPRLLAPSARSVSARAAALTSESGRRRSAAVRLGVDLESMLPQTSKSPGNRRFEQPPEVGSEAKRRDLHRAARAGHRSAKVNANCATAIRLPIGYGIRNISRGFARLVFLVQVLGVGSVPRALRRVGQPRCLRARSPDLRGQPRVRIGGGRGGSPPAAGLSGRLDELATPVKSTLGAKIGSESGGRRLCVRGSSRLRWAGRARWPPTWMSLGR